MLTRLFVSFLAPAFIVPRDKGKHVEAGPTAAPAKGKTVPKVLLDNDKVRVFEVRFRRGDEHRSVPSSAYRVARALSGGTMMRTYADGTTKQVGWTTGEVRFNEPSRVAYTTRNIGETDVHLYVVELKEPEK